MELILSILIGISLAAACGFRVFVPLLVMSIASLTGNLNLSGDFNWIGTYPAMISFAVATLIEIGGYYIPWLDNLLDTISSPLAVVAGIVATTSVIDGMNPILDWTISIIAGGSAAGLMQLLTVKARAASSAFTAGAGNPFLSTAEAVTSTTISLAAIFIPIAAVFFIVVVSYLLLKRIRKRRERLKKATTSN